MKNLILKLFHPTYFKRYLFFFLSDILIIVFSLYFSFLVRFDFSLSDEYRRLAIEVIPVFLIVKLSVFAGFRLCRITWKYVGLRDLMNMASAVLVSEAILLLLLFVPQTAWHKLLFLSFPSIMLYGFPRSVFLIDGANSLIMIFLLRISKRLYYEVFDKNIHSRRGLNTLVIGAGNIGEMIIRDMSKHGFTGFRLIGLLDDNIEKTGTYIHGIKVLGPGNILKEVVQKMRIEAVIIAIPSLTQKALKRIYGEATDAGVTSIKIIPRIYDFNRPEVNLKSLESIKIEELIGRQAVEVDYKGINSFLNGKSVLITGAGGSIGSELSVQVIAASPKNLVFLDIDETELHNLELKLKKTFPHLFKGRQDDRAGVRVSFVVADIRDRHRIDSVFRAERPEIVFHAAAYKHVPMMEYNPNEAVKVNIFGAYRVASVAARYGTDKFVMISTDKAVRPTSIMGATKRMAEYVCKSFNGSAKTEFVSVRFGNVLGSRGSVLPLFMDQLKSGGPLTVTHRDMKRYFMTIPEAVSLVLQASLIGKGGEVMALDMGEPIKIVELAEELIRIHGLVPHKDIDIEFTDPRPGEKLFEEILTAEEGTRASMHKKIFIANDNQKFTLPEMEEILKEFEFYTADLSPFGHKSGVKDLLKKYVRHFDEQSADNEVQRAQMLSGITEGAGKLSIF